MNQDNFLQLILDAPTTHGDRTFLIDTVGGRSFSFIEFHDLALRIAADLQQRGLKPGDRVALVLHNSGAFAALYLGCLYARLVTVPINPTLGRAEVRNIVTRCQARLLVLSDETAQQVDLDAVLQAGVTCLRLLDGRGTRSADLVEGWDPSQLPDAKSFVPLDGASEDDTMTIVFTSGTTGQPAGVVHRIADLVGNARLFANQLGVGPENRFYGVLAMTYMGGYFNLLMLPLLAGSSVVLRNAFDSRAALDFWSAAEEHEVNTLWLVPTILSILLEMDRGQAGEALCREQIRLALIGTAPLPTSLRRRFEQRYGVKLYENYALSETFFVTSQSPRMPTLDGTVGRTLPGIELSVADEQGAPLPAGREGEVLVRTKHLFEGYLDLDSATVTAVDRDSWFPTGDLGILSEAGDLAISGRKKDLIIRGGVNISPAQIETVLREHPDVLDSAVVGIPHALYGEEIAAVVRLERDGSLQEIRPALIELCRAQLGSGKQPAQLLDMIEFPTNAAGKVNKGAIREALIHKLGLTTLRVAGSSGSRTRPATQTIPGTMDRAISRPPRPLVDRLGAFPARTLAAVRGGLGAMDSALRPLVSGRPFVGTAVTAEECAGGQCVTGTAIQWIEPGDVLVVDARGSTSRACWDERQTREAVLRGAQAVVLNGTARNLAAIEASGLPVYALGLSTTPATPTTVGNINRPVACGGVVVQPGDILVGDDDGIVVVPQDLAAQILEACEQNESNPAAAPSKSSEAMAQGGSSTGRPSGRANSTTA